MLKFLGGVYRKDSAARQPNLPRVPGAPQVGGLVAGSRLATVRGWVPIEDLRVGDMVMTFDTGPQPVTCLSRRLYPYGPDEAARPVIVVPKGLIGNSRPLTLLPDQVVVVESDLAEAMTGDPFAPIRAASLAALPGVREMLPEESVTAAAIGFAQDQIVFVDGQTLALCPAAAMLAPVTLDEALFAEEQCRYRVLEDTEAQQYLQGIAARGGKPDILH